MKDSDKTNIAIFSEKIKETRKKNRKEKAKKILRIIVVLSILVMITFMYLQTSISKIKTINVIGNSLLTKEEILTQAEIAINDYYVLQIPFVLENRLKKHYLIDDAKVKWHLDRSITIEVTEEKSFGYRFDDKPYIILRDNTMIEMDETNLHLLPHLPFIKGFDSDELQKELIESFSDVNEEMLLNVSEIHQFAKSYDDKMVRIYMNDGNQVFASFQSVYQLNHYYDILKLLNGYNNCIYIDELSKEAYTSDCP